ncbi:DUF1501 domain-containing protein [Parendozoicomonas haliclonae]|uniref:Uncharacterized protein n=1 Tax=Parendozoicomonas haliclonae TaxID=1960125 RepID=A0A1X7ANU8_9GAMM|nr:DUF1501 domain-containing protein [Parendozoicomonas haliclonae]SMA49935.1 hypothetical protein EHSB41UT_03726 [Parendozoicomonas haliclonae]
MSKVKTPGHALVQKELSRRKFLQHAGIAMAGSGLFMSSYSGASLFRDSNGAPLNITRQDRAMVFIMLDGGNDSFNMLVPTSDKHYAEYKQSRSNLAHNKADLLGLDGFTDKSGRTFGLHPSMKEVQGLFNNQKLSFVANIGPMIERVQKEQFYANSVRLPVGLLSHADQFRHWQTSRPGERVNRGWFGSLADSLQSGAAASDIPMNISLAGSNIMQDGLKNTSYAITDKGSIGMVFKDQDAEFDRILQRGVDSILNRQYSDPFKQTYAAQTARSQGQHETFSKALNGVNVSTAFSDTPLSQQLRMVARTIKASSALQLPQQTFFIRYIGWDHHDELLSNQAGMLKIVSQALGEFQSALDELSIADKVVTFTGSDFGRTLTSNGNGTDHGWGGNTMVMGEPVQGGQVFGEFPSLKLDSDLDVGDGVLIPTTSTDELYGELAMWFGAREADLPKLFPNIGNFYRNGAYKPLGVIQS